MADGSAKIRIENAGIAFGATHVPFRMVTGMRYHQYSARSGLVLCCVFAAIGTIALVAAPPVQNETPAIQRINAIRYPAGIACLGMAVLCVALTPKRYSVVLQLLPDGEIRVPASSRHGAGKIMAALREHGVKVEEEGFWFIFWW